MHVSDYMAMDGRRVIGVGPFSRKESPWLFILNPCPPLILIVHCLTRAHQIMITNQLLLIIKKYVYIKIQTF